MGVLNGFQLWRHCETNKTKKLPKKRLGESFLNFVGNGALDSNVFHEGANYLFYLFELKRKMENKIKRIFVFYLEWHALDVRYEPPGPRPSADDGRLSTGTTAAACNNYSIQFKIKSSENNKKKYKVK